MKKLSLLFVLVLAFVMLFAFSASAKNITKEADFSMANGGSLCQKDYVVDDNYHTAASNGKAQSYVDYYFTYETGRTISRIRVIYNSVGENMGVCTYEELSTYTKNIICRVKNADGKQIELQAVPGEKDVVYDAEGKVSYTYIDFVPEEGTSWTNITWINVPTVHDKNEKTCIWEIDIFDDEACTDATHEFVADYCNAALKCNACGATKEETSHPYLPANCARAKTCIVCKEVVGEPEGEHILETDDNDCSTAVHCTRCNSVAVAAKKHAPDANGACTNAGCTRVGEINVANKAVVESSGDWGAVHKEQLVDGDRNTSTHSPKSSGFSYSFSFADKVLVSKLIVVVNGTSSTLVPNVPTATNNAIYEVTIELQDENGFKIYETETYKVENDATIVEVVLPYTYYASKVVAKFTSRELWGNSFVREVEIYSTTVEKLDPAFVEIVAPQEGCFDRVNFKDYISEKFYTAKDNDGFYYVTDEDGNLILDEKGNKIFYAGVVRGGNSNGEGCELDGVAGSGYCLKYNGWTNSIQYNFNSKLLIADITIGFSVGGNPENGYTLWVGNVVDGVEVWTQVVDFTVGEENTNQYLSRTFILGEEGEGVEASMFRFYWKAGKYGSFSEKTLCEIDMTAFKNTCTWTENKVDVEGNCGYDRVAKCTCSVCGVEKTVVTALATGEHDLTVTKEATKATCVDFGYNTTKYCATCQKTFGGDRIEKPLGHDMSVAATCTTAKSCSRCDHTEGNPLGHKQATAATCTQKATCSVCNEEYGKLAAHTLDANLKCSACQKYVVNSDAEFKTALEKAQANADADTILLLNDVTSAKFTITTELTLDLGGKTLKLTNGHRGMDTKHDKCAIINGTINYIGKVSAIGVYQLGKLENVEIALTYDGKDGHRNVTGIALLNTATTRIGSLTNVDINSTDGNNEVVDFRGIETYQCSGSEYVIGSMDNVSIDVNNTAMIVFAPIGTVSNSTIKSAKTAILFRAAGDFQTELTLVNCTVEGGEVALEIWNDASATANSKLILKSDAATTFTSENGVPYTVSIGGAVDNVSIQISGVQFAALANGTLYGSFEEAYAATPAGGTIELLADLELTDSLVIDKKITLDLNTYTVSAPNGVAGDGVFHVVAGGELTIKGNGTVNGICANKDGYHMAIFVNGGNVVIEGGTFTNVGENLTDDQYDLIYVKGGELVINGGTFIAQTPKWTLNLHDKTPGSIVVNGGSFYAYNPSASESEKPVANFVADNKCAVLNDKDYYDVINHVKGGEWLYDAETDKMVKTCVNCSKVVETTAVVAKINSIGYASLEAAVAVGGEITLEANIDLATAVVINNIVTINLNGKTLTVKKDTVGDGVFCVVAGGELTINGEGIVNGVGNNNYNIAIWANGGSVVINGGTYTNVGATDENGDDHFDLIYAKNGGSVVINGGTFIAQTPKWTLNLKDGDGSTIVVNGGSFYAYNPTESTSEGPVVDFTSGKCAVKNSENYYVLGEHQYFNSCDARCEACGKITKEPTHNIVHVTAKAPTCTANGNVEYWYCDICGAAWTDEALTQLTNQKSVIVPATGHSYANDCDKACAVCYEITRPEADHTIVHVDAKAATCTANGNKEYWTCSDCGYAWLDEACTLVANQKSVIVPATGHSYFTQCDPVCMNCYELTNPDAAHKITHVTAVAPTCTENGNIEYWYCEYCNTAWTSEALNTPPMGIKSTTLPATGHTKVEIPAVRPTPSNGNKAYTAGIKCADCNDIIQEVEEITVVQNQNTGFQIYNASLGLSDDITLIYLTYIPEEYRENAYMVFTYRGTEYVVDTKEEKDGIYRFRFSAVTPQYVGENIESVLYSKVNGEYVKTGTINYSVLAFCASWLNYDKTPVKTRTLMSDFLVYAAAAQVATNVNVDKLVTDGFGDKLTPSTFSKLDDSQFVMRLEGTADSRFAWKNVSLTLGSSVAMKFYFTATETENLKIKITINGRTQIIDFADCEYDTTYECYTASFTNITAIEFADEVKAEFMVGEEIVGNSALYTIDSFVYQWQSVTDSKYEKTINLVKALYNYGKSAWNSVH